MNLRISTCKDNSFFLIFHRKPQKSFAFPCNFQNIFTYSRIGWERSREEELREFSRLDQNRQENSRCESAATLYQIRKVTLLFSYERHRTCEFMEFLPCRSIEIFYKIWYTICKYCIICEHITGSIFVYRAALYGDL